MRFSVACLLFLVSCFLPACSSPNITLNEPLLGTYRIVDREKTLEEIAALPDGSLNEYEKGIHAGHVVKFGALEVLAKHPRGFILPTGLEGSFYLGGMQNHGGWKHAPELKEELLLYSWISGSIYNYFGKFYRRGDVYVLSMPGGYNLYFSKDED